MQRTISFSLLAAALAACTQARADQATPVAPLHRTAVPLVAVTARATPELLRLTGKITADQRAEVTAETSGKVVAVLAERGQRVKKGDAILRLDVRSAALNSREATARLAAARADANLAQVECARAERLFARNAISRSELDRETAQCSASSEQVAAASAHAQQLATTLSDGVVRAPFDGVVAERQISPGEWVAPGRSLFTLVDADPLEVELAVPEENIRAVVLGARVALTTVAWPGRQFTATVTRIGAEVAKSRSLAIEATVAATPELVPGMFVEAELVTGEVARPVVPASAVVKKGKAWHAFVARDGVLEERIVTLGPAPGPGQVSIVRNLAPGEQVVRVITDDIVDGLAVE